MLIATLAIIIGAIFLYWSAGRFVIASVQVASYFKLSPFFVGAIIMGFATSAPELFTSIIAAIENVPAIAIGNAYGSNIANIGLCIGFAALLKPIKVNQYIVKKEFPFLLLITLISVVLLLNQHLSRVDGVVLLVLFIIFFAVKLIFSKRHVHEQEAKPSPQKPHSLSLIIVGLVGSFLLLLASVQALIWGAERVALFFHVSELVIGLSVVAIGTSLPECAATAMAVKHNEADLALGNIIGSNVFNTLAAVGITSVITPVVLPQAILYRDVALMSFLTLLFLFFSYKFNAQGVIGRFKGAVLLVVYVLYLVTLGFFMAKMG